MVVAAVTGEASEARVKERVVDTEFEETEAERRSGESASVLFSRTELLE